MAKVKDNDDRLSTPLSRFKSAKGVLVKKDGEIPTGCMEGTVVAVVGRSNYVVPKGENINQGKMYVCFMSGTVISDNTDESTLICVGDKVWFETEGEKAESGDDVGTIYKINERMSELSRILPANKNTEQVIASNSDKLLILMSAKEPVYKRRLIDRFLIAAESGLLEPAICINKIDIADDNLEEDFTVYSNLGIQVFLISAMHNTGVEKLTEYLEGSTSILAGPSGSGKSTLINLLSGEKVQKVKMISPKTSKGMHTTSFAKMFEFRENFRIIDTPGIREFGIYGIEKEDISLYFHEFDDYRQDCRFSYCTHTHEPGCEVVQKVEEGIIDYDRYESYVFIYETMNE